MKPLLPNKTNAPPGGWSYDVPETGAKFRGKASEHQLLTDVKAHYRAAGYDAPKNLAELIEEWICRNVGDYCTGSEPRPPTLEQQTANTFHIVLQGTATLISHLAGGRERVSLEQAEARAVVCSTCRYNQEIHGCTGCNMPALTNLVEKVAGARRIPSEGALKGCIICSCHLKAKVHLMHETIWKHMRDGQKKALPDFCWLNTEQRTTA